MGNVSQICRPLLVASFPASAEARTENATSRVMRDGREAGPFVVMWVREYHALQDRWDASLGKKSLHESRTMYLENHTTYEDETCTVTLVRTCRFK